MKDKRKILFFLPSNTGGAERMTVNIAKMLPLDRFEVKFVILQRTLGTIVNFIPKGYEIIHIPIRNIYCAATLRMLSVIRKEKPDVVFSSLLYLNARLIVAAKLAGVKVIVRNNIDLFNTTPVNKRLAKLTYRWADKVVAQQEEMKNEIISVLHLSSNRVITLQNPIDTALIETCIQEPSPYTNEDSNVVRYVLVGRFSHGKGQDVIVRAFKMLLQEQPNSLLYLIGAFDPQSECYKEVSDFCRTNQIDDKVSCIGFDANPYRWVKNADCYVMPSRKEGLPNSLIDAMYLGKPVVATKCIPVIDRIVADGYNGYTVPSEDIEAMANAMLKAPQLKGFNSTYCSASSEDFIRLFESIS